MKVIEDQSEVGEVPVSQSVSAGVERVLTRVAGREVGCRYLSLYAK